MTQTIRRNLGPKRRRRLLGASMLLALLFTLVIGTGPGQSNPGLDAITQVDCNANAGTAAATHYSDPNDKSSAIALKNAGFSCTGLFNKPTVASGQFQQVGELWHKLSGTVLQMRVIFFFGPNTGFGDEKVCLDDDANPINNVAPGGANPAECVGGDAPLTFNQGANNGPSYPPAKAANVAPEEPSGKYEIKIENLIEVSETFGGFPVGGWNVNINGYTEVVPHFNTGGFSILGFFQPVRLTNIKVTKSDSADPINLGANLTYTLLVENTTSVAAANVVVDDDLPSEATFVSATPSVGSCPTTPAVGAANGTVICNLGTLAGGASATVTIVVNVTPNTANCGRTINNHVDVSTTTQETSLLDNSDDEPTTIQCAAIRILKDSSKGGRVLNAGAVFSVTGPSPSTASFGVTDDNTAAVPDEDADIGEVCVSNLVPGSYDVMETSPPSGYAGDTDTETAIAVGGTNCTGNLPSGTGVVTFVNRPLTDLDLLVQSQVSGETRSRAVCIYAGPDNVFGTGDDVTLFDTGLVDPADVDLDNLVPGEYRCNVTIDP